MLWVSWKKQIWLPTQLALLHDKQVLVPWHKIICAIICAITLFILKKYKLKGKPLQVSKCSNSGRTCVFNLESMSFSHHVSFMQKTKYLKQNCPGIIWSKLLCLFYVFQNLSSWLHILNHKFRKVLFLYGVGKREREKLMSLSYFCQKYM